MSLMPFLVIWIMLASAVLALLGWRRAVSQNEDDSIHVLHADTATAQQVATASKLEMIDKWGKLLTIITVVFGLILGSIYVYQSWVQSSTGIAS